MTLAEEAQRYLAVVDFFRAQGCEPRWRPERVCPPAATDYMPRKPEVRSKRNPLIGGI